MIDYSEIDMRDALFKEVYNILSQDKNVIFINADTPAFGLLDIQRDFPNQYINTGVSEQSMILAAAGLAMSSKKVFIYSLIPFIALRCYEFIKVNICSMNLPVTIIGGGAGLSFSYDGATHHAVCDIALMRTLPEMSIYNPSDSYLATLCVRRSYESHSPSYIRLDKGKYETLLRNDADDGFSLLNHNFSPVRYGFARACIISSGIMSHTAIQVARKLKEIPIKIDVIDLYKIKPINAEKFIREIVGYNYIVTLEENSIIGGIGSIVSEIITDNNVLYASKHNISLKRIALPDAQSFIYGSREWLHKQYQIDCESVTNSIVNWLRGN